MAALEHKGMVVVDGVRWPLELLEELFPDKVKDAVPVRDAAAAGDGNEPRVDTVPGGVITGTDAQGAPVVDTTDTAAANGVVTPDAVPSGTVGSGDKGAETGNGSKRRTRSKE